MFSGVRRRRRERRRRGRRRREKEEREKEERKKEERKKEERPRWASSIYYMVEAYFPNQQPLTEIQLLQVEGSSSLVVTYIYT